MRTSLSAVLAVTLMGLGGSLHAQPLSADLKAKLDVKVKQLQRWSTDPVIVGAVRDANSHPSAAMREMTNTKWKYLTVIDPVVRSISGNALSQYLKSKHDEQIVECFVSAADGTKVAFLSKPTNWSHSALDKHTVPMTGKVWIGPSEVDVSSGQLQVQVGLPVLDGGRPIGSIVVGLSVEKLQ